MTVKEIFEILDNCCFDELTEDNMWTQVEPYLPHNVTLCHGVTKAVLLFPDTDFVIKIPFGGMECENEEFDGEDPDDEYYFESFQFAEDGETGDDYCKVEVLKYDRALDFCHGKMDVAQLFAQTSFLGYVHNYPIYAQPVCTILCDLPFEDYAKKSSSPQIETIKDSCAKKGVGCFSAIWLADVLNYYGQEILDKLYDFLDFEGIEDLHEGNLGYIGNRPVIVDYAGFNE